MSTVDAVEPFNVIVHCSKGEDLSLNGNNQAIHLRREVRHSVLRTRDASSVPAIMHRPGITIGSHLASACDASHRAIAAIDKEVGRRHIG